ncbi:MAG: O-antigen ligase family protein [Acidobacteria bacterium]|nr:O-antigen ligase family protein [Acidobacteriota bacterium]
MSWKNSFSQLRVQIGVSKRGKHYVAFLGVYIFTFLLYLRPNDVFPALGTFPLVKIWAILSLIVYLISKRTEGERTIWTIEARMMLVIVALTLIHLPVSGSRQESWDMLTETYIKVMIIFVLMNNLIDTRQRLNALLQLVVLMGAIFGIFAVRSYMRGDFTIQGLRIEGIVGGMFGNPNDLATAFDTLLPLTVVMAIIKKKFWRLFYLACTVAIMAGIVATFSRSGFLGLVTLCGVLFWKLGRGRRISSFLFAIVLVGGMFYYLPGNYKWRITSIFEHKRDEMGSAQARMKLLERAMEVTYDRSFLGVGMGNMKVFSHHEMVAHNAYLEIFVELSVIGLIAYLIIILNPLRTLRRIELETAHAPPGRIRDKYYLCLGIQASIAAYIVCSAFGSIQYQWYLYYIVAYAVALRRVHEIEVLQGEVVERPVETMGLLLFILRTKGVLWSLLESKKGVLMTKPGKKTTV